MERRGALKLSVHVIADLVLPVPTPTTLQIEAAQVAGVQAVESPALTVAPFAEAEPFLDFYGNPCRRLMMVAGDVRLEYAATVTLPDAPSPPAEKAHEAGGAHEADALHLPTDALLYTLPSRYCQSDKMVAMAQDMFGDVAPGFARVQTVCDWINAHITYQYGVSDAGTSAYDTAAQRIGVCRDFAHLGIAFCRALNIPARYVSGYCLGLAPPTSTPISRHGWTGAGWHSTLPNGSPGPHWCKSPWDATPPTVHGARSTGTAKPKGCQSK